MARAVGDTALQWTAWTDITWSASGPDGVTNGNMSGLSAEIDLSALDNVEDVQISSKAKTASGTLGSNPNVQTYVAAPADDTNYPASASNYLPVGIPQTINAANTTEYSEVANLSDAFRGPPPKKFKAAMKNNSGLTLAGTSGQATENLVKYRALYRNTKLS